MAEKFTDEQRKAIDVSGGTVLVGAAAGSGKTTVMAERIVRELCDESAGVKASRILVLTFSRAAARGMRNKIKQRMQEMADSIPGVYVREQNRNLPRAQISTVHSFCAVLLREYFSKLDIAPDFTLAEDSYLLDMKEKAMTDTAEECYGEFPEEMAELSALFGKSRSDSGVFDAVRAVYAFKRNLADPGKWERGLQDGDAGNFWKETAFAAVKEMAEEMKQFASQMNALLDEDAGSGAVFSPKYRELAGQDADIAGALLDLAEKKDWDGIRTALSAGVPSLPTAKPRPVSVDGLKRCHTAFRDMLTKSSLIRDLFSMSLDEAEKAEADASAAMGLILKICRKYEERLEQRKKARRVLEYDDLEILALRLLYDENGALTEDAKHVASRFDRIYVDEFQDTNGRQKLIFDAVDAGRGRLFFVGDVKQSIYRFRNADCRIFTAVRDECRLDPENFPKYLALHDNFRSNTNVIGAVNSIFTPLMRRELGGVDYAGEELNKGQKDGEPEAPSEPGLELHLLNCSREELAEHAARYIKGLIDSRYKVLDHNEWRDCRESDFAVLLGVGKNVAPMYQQKLSALGVKSTAAGAQDYFDAYEIMVTVSLLRILDNPLRNVDMAAVMMSPLFGFTADEMARLRIRERRGFLWNTLLTSEDEKCRTFVEKIKELRSDIAVMNVTEAVEHAITATDAELLLTAPPDTVYRKARLRALIGFASACSSLENRDLGDFLRICEKAAEMKKGPEVAAATVPDGVTVTTIHKAKGLQWPIVILGDASHQFNLRGDATSNLLMDDGYGAGVRMRVNTQDGAYYIKSPTHALISAKQRSESLSEEMRVLYVALTRAEQKIAVFGDDSGAEKDGDKLLQIFDRAEGCFTPSGDPRISSLRKNQSFTDFLKAAFSAAGFSAADAEEGDRTRGALRLLIESPAEETEETAAVPEETVEDEGTEALAAALDERLSSNYPKPELSSVPTKVAVTDITERRSGDMVSRPSFTRGGTLSAAEKGTALHRFMELCDYRRAAEDPAAEIERLKEGLFMEPAYADAVDAEAVRGFMRSDIGRQALAADRLLREYAFIDSIPARELPGGPADSSEQVLVQGIADCVIVKDGSALLVDYKTDRVKSGEELLERYAGQLRFYKKSVEKRLGIPVRRCVIWSFRLNEAIEVECSP